MGEHERRDLVCQCAQTLFHGKSYKVQGTVLAQENLNE
jgi:hypothetical protein